MLYFQPLFYYISVLFSVVLVLHHYAFNMMVKLHLKLVYKEFYFLMNILLQNLTTQTLYYIIYTRIYYIINIFKLFYFQALILREIVDNAFWALSSLPLK